jgi:hypothetical protein
LLLSVCAACQAWRLFGVFKKTTPGTLLLYIVPKKI